MKKMLFPFMLSLFLLYSTAVDGSPDNAQRSGSRATTSSRSRPPGSIAGPIPYEKFGHFDGVGTPGLSLRDHR